MKNVFIHPSADVQTKSIGKNSKIWQFVVILPNANIGNEVNICSHCLIENNVIIGDRVTIKSGVQIWDGLTIENDVFVGPNVTFTNDPFPRSKKYHRTPTKTLLQKGSSIGANATILPGIVIGQDAMIAAGSVVTKSVPEFAIVAGNPARIIGYTNTLFKDLEQNNAHQELNKKIKSKVKGVIFYNLKNIEDIRGNLSVCEFEKELPFSPKRYFLVYDVPGSEVRGEHAHIECHQFLVAAKGSLNVIVNDGKNREIFVLNKNTYGLYIPPHTWSVQYNYSSDSVLLVFASHLYQEKDYIRNWEDFLQLKSITNKNKKRN